MKKHGKIFLLTLLIIVISSISVINATDISQNDTTMTMTTETTSPNNDNIQTDTTPQTTKKINKNTQSSTKEATETVTNYDELYSKLTDTTASEDTTITLGGEEKTYTITNTITLSESIKNLVIEGNQKTITGNKTKSFLIANHTCNITINNLTIENCSSTTKGGAISQEGGKLNINNSSFNNNKVTGNDVGDRYGGAISAINTEVTIENSDFKNNIVNAGDRTIYGGALLFNATTEKLNIMNSSFQKNGISRYSESNAGAIHIETNGNVSICNSQFKENIGHKGGAITYYNTNEDSSLIIDHVRFDSNGKLEESTASAIYIVIGSDVNITNSVFLNNQAQEAEIICEQEIGSNDFKVENCIFKSNGFSTEHWYPTQYVILANDYENVYIINSTFNDNAASAGIITLNSVNNTIIKDSIFDGNGKVRNLPNIDGQLLDTRECNNITIVNSTFINNNMEYGISLSDINASIFKSRFINNTIGADTFIKYDNTFNDSSLNITDSLFDSNKLTSSGLLYLYTINGDIHITNTNFTYNGLNLESDSSGENNGLLICNYPYMKYIFLPDETIILKYNGSNLLINNSNFEGNGLQNTEKDINLNSLIYHEANTNLTIDNSNFTSNCITDGEGGIIISRAEPYNLYLINNTSFKDNKIVHAGEDVNFVGLLESVTGYIQIDNSIFSNNKYDDSNIDKELIEEKIGVIKGLCNVTNTVFADNYYANFIIRNNRIVLDTTNDAVSTLMDDSYIPDFGNVVIYVDESEEGTPYLLVSETDPETGEKTTYIKDFIVNDENYVIKMVVNQTSQSQYYDYQTFHNNTFYFILPHDYKLTVEATSPIYVGDNTTINGRVYYTKSNGTEIAFTEKPVDLYINYTYITTVNTDENGEYVFNYTGNVIGTQNVTIGFNKTIYLPKTTNTTTFTVLIRESILNINVNNTKIGEKTNITFTLKDTTGKPINNAPIQYIVDDKIGNGTTDENGEFTYTCEIEYTGHNYVIARYDGNYSYTNAINSTIFTVDKLNTTATITATNTTIGKETTITGKITDENNKGIKVPVIIYIDEETINTETDETGEFTFTYPATLSGENHVAIFYEGNDTYADSTNKTSFHVEKHNTTITVTAQNTKLGEKTTIKGKLVDENGNPVNNAPIIVFIEDEEVDLSTDANGEFTYNYTTRYENENFVEVFFEGNNTHKDSFNHATFNVTKKTEPRIDIDVLNDTVGNVEVEVTVTDDEGNPLPEQTVEVTLPDGTKTNMTTDNEGKILIKDTTTPEGNTSITVKVPDSGNVTGSEKTKTINIEPDYQKIIDDMNKTIENLNDTVQDQNKTINDLEETLNTLNKTSKITVIPENGSVEDNNVIVTLENKQGNPITNAPITIKNSKGETIGNSTTDNNGIAIIPVSTKAGTENITVSYQGDNNFTPSNTTISVTTTKNNVTVTVDPVNGVIGENIILTAHIRDSKGNPVNGGNIVFKLNGKTLRQDGSFNSTAEAWKFTVKDGKVTVIIKADLYLRNIKNLTASYSGTYKYEAAKSEVVTAQIKKRDAKIIVTSTPQTQKQYQTITFKATLTDTTQNYQNKTAINTDTKVLFKINGKTIKDSTGKNLLVKVVNNTATYKYTVPQGMAGVTKEGQTRNYNIETVLVSDTYYPDTRATTNFNVQRSPTTIKINKISLNSNKLTINANILDYKNKAVNGNSSVAIKINGKTYVNPTTRKSQTFKVTDGKINLKNIALSKDITVKSVMIVTGDRQAYLGCRNQTSNIVKV